MGSSAKSREADELSAKRRENELENGDGYEKSEGCICNSE